MPIQFLVFLANQNIGSLRIILVVETSLVSWISN